MPDTEQIEQLSHLLKLLDDNSPVVREAVTDALEAMSSDLPRALRHLEEPVKSEQLHQIEQLLEDRDIYIDLGSEITKSKDCEEDEVQFHLGELVRHKRYGYRGVVVDFDLNCQADDRWYQSNQTQPDRDQPWYHILVHDSYQVTYAAEASLVSDDSGEPVVHPLVTKFFSKFENGHYIRNQQPWPYQW